MQLRDQIVRQALALPTEDREYVADLLEGSLPTSEFASSGLAESWSREIDRRVEAYDRGESTALEFDEAMRQMRQALADHREARGGP